MELFEELTMISEVYVYIIFTQLCWLFIQILPKIILNFLFLINIVEQAIKELVD